jgi:hypothetical protein
LTWRDLLNGGVHVAGRTGAGKTSSMFQLARAFLKNRNTSMLFLCAKRGDCRDIANLAASCGRMGDAMIINPQHSLCLNLLGHEAERPGEGAGVPQNVSRFAMSMRDAVFRQDTNAGGDSKQWDRFSEELLTKSVAVLQFSRQAITPLNLTELITSAPTSKEQLESETWQENSYCSRCLAASDHLRKDSRYAMDYLIVRDYFTKIWPRMPDKTRGSIEAGTLAILSPMTLGVIRDMFGTSSNFTTAWAIENRKIVIVDMPPDEWGDAGMLANIGLKMHYQKDVLRRRFDQYSSLCCIWGDEASLWISDSDPSYLSRCRSAGGCMVYQCQSLNSYREVLPAAKADAIVNALLCDFGHKMFFTLGDYDSATWASHLCGRSLQMFQSGSINHAAFDPFALVREEGNYSSSFSTQYEQLVQPHEFMNGLRTGSRVNGYMVDAFLVRSGLPFSNGLNVLRVTFDQRK